MNKMQKKTYVFFLTGFFVAVNVFFLIVLMQGQNNNSTQEASIKKSGILYSEILEFEDKKLQSFRDISEYFISIAETKGAGYAFEVLKVAPIPLNIDMHLMAHIVGDILYVQEGIEGIKVCTHDFRNACSHTIVIGLFVEKGEAALPEIAETCYEAPGGSGAYTMCFHGLGHGILAYTGYDLVNAVELCEKTGTAKYNSEESSQCISGTIMEIINGVHDRELWRTEHEKYFKEDDPLYPCSSEFMPDEARPLCYLYLTPHLFEVAGADIGFPTSADFEKAFPLCEGLPASDFRNRDSCYGGFGKEFTVLALGRDIRASSIEKITNEQLERVYDWCLVAKNKEGITACLMNAMQSLYWGGENDRRMAVRFCGVLSDPYYEQSCFTNLIGAVSYYIKDQDYRREFCKELPASYQEACERELL